MEEPVPGGPVALDEGVLDEQGAGLLGRDPRVTRSVATALACREDQRGSE
jgi:hypothetical protein